MPRTGQDTFIRAFKGLKGVQGQSALATWYRIAVNVCLNRMALRTPKPEALELRPGRPARRAARCAALREGRRRSGGNPAVAAKQRATLILQVYMIPHEQIAGFGKLRGAAKANFSRARQLKKLRQ